MFQAFRKFGRLTHHPSVAFGLLGATGCAAVILTEKRKRAAPVKLEAAPATDRICFRSSASQAPAVFRFGVIADVQWADVPDGTNFEKTERRCFRGALKVLGHAVAWWKMLDPPPLFLVQLGDLIDSRNRRGIGSDAALSQALEKIHELPPSIPVHNIMGNHELTSFGGDRELLASRLNRCGEYYTFTPAPGWRFLVLDAFREHSSWPKGTPEHDRAHKLLRERNPNFADGVTSGKTDFLAGLEGNARRWVPFNGGLGNVQRAWIDSELVAAERENERVIIFSHVSLHPNACDGKSMLWDFQEALEVLAQHHCVVAVMCGHDHKGGYHVDSAGVHYLTLCSPLNDGLEGAAYGIVEVYADRFELCGPNLGTLLPSSRIGSAEPGTQLPPLQPIGGPLGGENCLAASFAFQSRSPDA